MKNRRTTGILNVMVVVVVVSAEVNLEVAHLKCF